MSSRRMFPLSIPVADLDAARRFCSDVLGATIVLGVTSEREDPDWLDVLLW